MRCSEIELTDFRNIKEEKIEFSYGINVLWGKNAQGKSNALEAVYYFARGRSFRGAKDRDLIRFGSEFTRIKSVCRKEGGSCRDPQSVNPFPFQRRMTLYPSLAYHGPTPV